MIGKGRAAPFFSALAIAAMLSAGAVALLPADPANAAGLNGTGPIRMSGADRYGTSQVISKNNFPTPTKAVFLATGTTFPDALAGGPAAGMMASPVILTAPTALSAVAAQELNRLRPATIYVLGGVGAVSNSVLTSARAYSANVVRLSGIDRFATAAGVSKQFWSTTPTVYVASGADFADALSGGALAAKMHSPILLTASGGLPDATRNELRRLAPSRVVVLGGTGAVSATVASQISGAVPGAAVSRIQGQDRMATSAAVSKAGWGSSSKAMYAVASNFPDALAGVAAAAVNGSPLLLTNAGCMPVSVWNESIRLGVTTKGILGGPGVLSITAASASCSEAAPFPGASATARSYSGYGDSVISISKPDGAASIGMATMTHRGRSNFIVSGLNSAMNWSSSLANEIGSYAGTVVFDESDWRGTTTKLQITADGPWTISIASVKSAPTFGRQYVSGRGDAVFNYNGVASVATLSHDGVSNFIVIMDRTDGSGDFNDLIVNVIGRYSGTRIWPRGPAVVSVIADGNWSAAIR